MQVRIWIHKIVLFSILFGIWHNAFAFAEPGASGEAVQPERPMLNFSISEEAARLSSAEAWSFTRINQVSDGVQLRLYVQARNNGSLVFNGERITYTIEIKNNTSQTVTRSNVIVFNQLPQDVSNKTQLDQISCTDMCEIEYVTSTITTPLGRTVYITEPVSVKWAFGQLGLGANASRTLSFSGRVVGQYDGAVIENQAYMTWLDDMQMFMFSPKVRTVVLVPAMKQGELDVSNVPTWHSSDLGGTISLDWGDFDHDGYLDLALGSTAGVKVYRNQGGRLVPLSSMPTTYTLGVRWADVIPGGNLELVAVGSSINNSAVMSGTNYVYGVTNNEVRVASVFTSEYQLLRLEAGDVDRNGWIDLVASNNAINTGCPVRLFKNNNGRFDGPGWCVVTNTATAAIALGDYNNDGYMDLALGYFPNQVVLINKIMMPAETLKLDKTTTFLPYDLQWGDYDGDGDLDLAAAFPMDQLIRVYTNSENVFTRTHEFHSALFYTPLALDWVDFNSDGRLDLFVASMPPVVYLNVGESAGWFSSEHRFTLPSEAVKGQVWDLSAVDQDNDGDFDLALGNRDSASLLFTAFAPLLRRTLIPIDNVSFSAKSVSWGDYDGDGLLDLAYGAGGNNVNSHLYLNQGQSFVLQKKFPAPQASVTWGNINRDSNGKLDLVLGSGTTVRIYFDGEFSSYWQAGTGNWAVRSVALGDLEGDGDLDLLVATSGPNFVYLNTGTGLNSTPVWMSGEVEDTRGVAWADYDRDGYLDFAAGNYGGPVRVYRNLGSQSFALAWSSPARWKTTSVAWGDVNGDGYLDLAVGNDGEKNLILANDQGTWGRVLWESNEFSRTTALAFGDWDNDGDLDLAVGNYGQPDQVYVNRGMRGDLLQLDWIWQTQGNFSTTGVAWGDVDNDGDLDLAVSGENSGSDLVNGVYLNNLRSVPDCSEAGCKPQMFNYPTCVLVKRPGMTQPAYFYSTPEILSGPHSRYITISYQLRDFALYTRVYTTIYEYSPDGGGTWKRATPGIAPSGAITIGNTPQLLNFVWDAWTDRVFSDNVLFRVTVIFDDPVGPVQYARTSAVSPPFRVSSNWCTWPEHPTIKVTPANPQPDQEVVFEGTVSRGSGKIDFRWDLGDGTTKYGQVVRHTYRTGGRYTVTLSVASEPCPLMRVVTSTQQLIVGVGGYNVYLPLVGKSFNGSSVARASADVKGTTSSEQLPNIDYVYGPDRPDAVQTGSDLSGLTQLESVIHAVVVTDVYTYTDCSLNNVGQPCKFFTCANDVYNIYSQPAVNFDGKRVTFWSTANPHHTNPDQNIEVFVSGPITNSQIISLTQVTSSTGSVLGGFSLWPSLSADGTRLVMFSDQDLVTGKNRDQNFEIFVYDFASSSFIQITETEECVNLYPSISADGRRVAYVSSCDGSSGSLGQNIVVAEIDQSSQVTRIWSTSAQEGGYYAQPAISGNGRYVVFVHLGPSTTGTVKMRDLDAGETIDILDGSHPDVNYDGTRVVFVRDNNIFMARRDDPGVLTFTQITTDSEKENEQPSIDGEGNRIVYINRDGVWVYDWATRARTKLTAQKDVNSRPMIGDGGGHVVYASERQICYAEFPLVDLEVTKRSEKPSLVPGTPVTFTVVITNRGPSDVVGAYITDTWGSFIQLQRVQCGTEVTNIITGNSTLTALLSLPAGTQTTCTFWGSLSSAASGTVTNCVQVSAPVGVIEHITTNNQSCDSHIPHPEADLVITKLAPYSRVVAGEKLTYTVYYTNNGPSNATQVYITDILPVSTTFGAMLGPGGSLPLTTSEGLVWWNIGTVTESTGGILTFTVLFGSDILTNTVLTNEVRITSGVTDPMTADNRSAFTVMIGTRSDLAITKFAEPDPVAAGSLLTYTLVFTNYGPSDAGNVCITDTLPVSMTWKEQLVPAWTSSYTLSGNQVYWCGNLTRSVTGTIRFVVTTSGDIAQPGVFTNVVSITHPSDTYTGNNTCRVGTNVHIPIDLQVRKVASSGQVSPGEPVTWTIWVTNTSSRFEVMSVTVSDSLPVGVLKNAVWMCQDSVINSSCGQISGSLPLSQTIAWLGAHGAVTYTIVGTVFPSMTGSSLVNTAFVTLPAGYLDPVSGGNQAQVTVTLSPKADLGIHKHAWPEPVVAGTTLTYTIVLTNAGPAYARPVTLTDHLTTAVQYGGMVAGNPPTVTGSTVVWRWDELCDHCTRTVQFTVTVRSDVLTGTQITNTAVVSSDAHDPVINNSVAVSTGVHAKADLSVSKSASTENGVLTYTLVYTNGGPSYAREVYITDTLPVSVTWGGVATSSGGWTAPVITSTGGVTYVRWYSPSLAVTTGTIVYTVTVNPGVSDGALLTNTVAIATDTPDPIAGNNWFTVTTMMPVAVDLSVSKSAMSDVVVAGELLTYTLILTNNSPSFGCHGVYVTDTLPSGVTVHEYTPSVFGSSVVSDAGQVAWHIPFLSPGVTGSITVVVLVGADVGTVTPLVNTAEITGCKDMVVANNVHTTSTTVHAVADLAVTKVGDGQVVAGNVLTYTLVYTNGGPSYARGVYITDTLPVSVTWGGVVTESVDWSDPVITSTEGVTYVHWYSASLAVTTGTIVYTVTVAPDVPDGDVITNTVTITSNVQDEAVNNNQNAITTTVSREADLAIVKQVDSFLTNSITYTLIYTNYGPSVAKGIEITDTWDGEASGRGITDSIAVLCLISELAKKIITCTIDHLPPGESGRITVVLKEVKSITVTNVVSIASSAHDPISDNNHAMVTTTLQADLAITKSVESANPFDGVLTWTLSYANYGPLDASAVYITDTLPVSVIWGGVVTESVDWSDPVIISTGGVTYVQWYSPSLAVTTGTIVYTVTVNPDVSDGALLTNTVVITTDTPDPIAGNNWFTVTTMMPVAVDLSVSKSAMSDVVVAGELLTYTLILTNNNPSFGCHGVYVTDTLPSDVTVHEYTPSVFGSSVVSDAGQVAWHIPFLSPGVTGSITVVVLVGADVVTGTPLVNTAEIAGCKDMVVANNVHTTSTIVHAVADLAVTKVGDGQVVAGNVLTYTLVYTNGGPSYAREVYITDILPVNVTWGGVVTESVDWSDPVITSTGGVTYVQWYSPSLAVTTGTIVYTVTVSPDVSSGDEIENTVEITSAVGDSTDGNNKATTIFQVARSDLFLVRNGLLRTLNTDLDLLAGNDRVENGNGQVSDGLPAGQAFANLEPLNRASFPEWPVVGPGGDKYARWFVGILILCLLKIWNKIAS